jgi:hypothetical protein
VERPDKTNLFQLYDLISSIVQRAFVDMYSMAVESSDFCCVFLAVEQISDQSNAEHEGKRRVFSNNISNLI